MYKITGKNTFEVAPDTNPAEGLLDGTYYNLDIEKMDGRTWHILKDHKSYYVQWVERSEDGKTFTLKINGQLLELNAKDHYDLLLEQMGMSAANTTKATKLKAPMPGKVLDVMVQPGGERRRSTHPRSHEDGEHVKGRTRRNDQICERFNG
jgi:pyruvate carboxylase